MRKSIVEMRHANFNLGCNLPENNKYSINNLSPKVEPVNFHMSSQGVTKGAQHVS